MIHVQAGTCMSRRTCGEPNGYNQLRFEDDEVSIIAREWNGEAFVDRETKRYGRGARDQLVKIAEVSALEPYRR